MAFERIEPGTPEWTLYYAHHVQRYEFAVDKLADVAGKKILDVACGVGYGANLLAERLGATVTAVDRDDQALRLARGHFGNPLVDFVQDDAHTLNAVGRLAPFDAVVSFETVEHLPRPADFLARLAQVLAPDGVLIISTPNATVTSPGGEVHWEFHEKEFTGPEFVAMLAAAGFRDVQLFGQATTPVGRLRDQLRLEIAALKTNPFFRLGAWIQRTLRGRTPGIVLPQTADDFTIHPLASAEACDRMGLSGPEVIIAVARR